MHIYFWDTKQIILAMIFYFYLSINMLFYCYSTYRLGRLNPCKPHLNAKRMLTSCLLFRACLGTKYFCGFNTIPWYLRIPWYLCQKMFGSTWENSVFNTMVLSIPWYFRSIVNSTPYQSLLIKRARH